MSSETSTNGTTTRAAFPTWKVRVSYRTRQGDLFETERHEFPVAPHTGDVMLILADAVEERDLARGRHSFIEMHPVGKLPTAINAADVATIQTFVFGPNGEKVTELEPGYLDEER